MYCNLHHFLQGSLVGCLLFAATACGDDLKPMPDASLHPTTRLEILTPPGDSIGLNFSESATLRVRYVDEQGQPIEGAATQFKFVSSAGESTGAASLSSTSVQTDELGIARVDLLSGAERVNFRVEASASQAPPVLFYIQVSEGGFADLKIRSAHEGPRDPESFDRIHLRIFNQAQVSCLNMDFDELPVSLFPARTQLAVGELSTFANLAADESYTVIAWGELDGGRPLATGCLELAADKLRSGSTFEASLTVVDRSFELPGPLLLATDIDLSLLRESLPGQESWDVLACPLGRAQLLLDCLADAQAADASMDCDGDSASPLSLAMAPRRGLVDALGCRGATDEGGASSLDTQLAQALGGWPSDTELTALYEGRHTVLDSLRIRSRLFAQSSTVASHRILEAELGSFVLDLVNSDRPVIEATGLPLSVSAAPILGLGDHGFTLRYGDIAAQAYEELALAPANVSMLGDALGAEFIDGLEIGAQSGCPALESFVCSNLALPAGCANGCAGVASPLSLLLAQWLPELVATGFDYGFAMQAQIGDADTDLRIDTISAQDADLSVELVTAGESLSLPATLSGALE